MIKNQDKRVISIEIYIFYGFIICKPVFTVRVKIRFYYKQISALLDKTRFMGVNYLWKLEINY